MIHRIKVSVRFVRHLLALVCHCMAVYVFQGSVISPAAAFHDVGIRHADCMHDGCAVMAAVMEAEVRYSGVHQNMIKSLGNHVWVEFRYSAVAFGDFVCNKGWKIYKTVSSV